MFNRVVSILIAIITLITTFVAYLQNEAGNADDRAARDSRALMAQILSQQVEGEAEVNFAYDTVYQRHSSLRSRAFAAENQGNEEAADRYRDAAEALLQLSPLMQAPYFDEESATVNLALYESDVYLTQVTRMREEYSAAVAVKEAWGEKGDAYIVHLTILAVALFLLGLSATIAGQTRWIFAVSGTGLASFATLWAFSVWSIPVSDLREQVAALDAYANAHSLSYQGRNEEAIAQYQVTLNSIPDYANAFAGRGLTQMNIGDYAAAISDLRRAQALNATLPNVTGNLAFAYYLTGQFAEAIAVNRAAVSAGGGELWQQFDIGLYLLASGALEEGRIAYDAAMTSTIQQVADARAAGLPPSSALWYSLDVAARDLQNFIYLAETGDGLPDRAKLVAPEAAAEIAQSLVSRLKSLSVGLEYDGQAPQGELSANIGELVFAEPLYDEDNTFIDYNFGDTFPFGVLEMMVLFDYAGMRDGQTVLLKTYLDGSELYSYRVVLDWDGGDEGTYQYPIVWAYSDTFLMAAGYYTVELYVDGHLAQTGAFLIEEAP